jgi:peptidoglycan hydrolase-like protein with peptidoglycan-binding domain
MTANVTGYFGGLTRAAVIKWQKAASITPATGYFGPKSRSAWNLGNNSGTTTAAATTTPPAPLVTIGFRDEVVANHDVRIYRDGEGRSVLLYGYWNQTTLVIARNPPSFTEILQRLATSRMEQ